MEGPPVKPQPPKKVGPNETAPPVKSGEPPVDRSPRATSRPSVAIWIVGILALGAIGGVGWYLSKRVSPDRKPLVIADSAGLRTQGISNIKQVATGVMIYTADFDDMLPLYSSFESAVKVYVKNDSLFRCVQDDRESIEYNERLSAYSITAVFDPSKYPMLRDPQVWPEGQRLYAFVDASAKSLSNDKAGEMETVWSRHPAEDPNLVSTGDEVSVPPPSETVPEERTPLRDDAPIQEGPSGSGDAYIVHRDGVSLRIPNGFAADGTNSNQWNDSGQKRAFVRMVFGDSDDPDSIVATYEAEQRRFQNSDQYQYEPIAFRRLSEYSVPAYIWEFNLNRNNAGWMRRRIVYTIYQGRTVALTTGVEFGYEELTDEVETFLSSVNDW
jgi:hypothetical protein